MNKITDWDCNGNEFSEEELWLIIGSLNGNKNQKEMELARIKKHMNKDDKYYEEKMNLCEAYEYEIKLLERCIKIFKEGLTDGKV